jgi:hypothetical protein
MNRFANRMTPGAVGAAAVSLMVLWAGLYIAQGAGLLSSVPFLLAGVFSSVLAYAIAMWLCVEIATEYRQSRDLRMAWIVLGLCAVVSMLRHLCDTPLVDLVWPGYWKGPYSPLLRELLAATALTMLAAGIFTMGEAFRRMRLGFSWSAMDLVAMAGVLSMLALVLYLRNDLSAARVESSLAKRAQLFSQVVFVVAAAGCVLLRRIAQQMGGGKLAIAMGWIIAHIVLRAVLVLLAALQVHLHKSLAFSEFLSPLALNLAIWMFALAAASRYEVSQTAARQAAKWGVASFENVAG